MNKRLKTTIALLVLFAITIWQAYTPFMPLLIAVFSCVGTWEVAKCASVQNKALKIVGCAYAFLYPFFAVPNSLMPFVSGETLSKITGVVPGTVYMVAYVLILMLIMLKGYAYTKFEHVAMVFVSSVFVSFGLTNVIHFRDLYTVAPDLFTKQSGIYILVVGAICAWGTDSGAYLGGRMFGKHKMAPKISPNKTMEGAVCGIIFSTVLNFVAFLLFTKITGQAPIPWYMVLILSIPVSFLGMMGDLTASVIKRNYGVKDFGNLFPGHGGVIDRSDSALFAFSAIYAIILAYIKLAQ